MSRYKIVALALKVPKSIEVKSKFSPDSIPNPSGNLFMGIHWHNGVKDEGVFKLDDMGYFLSNGYRHDLMIPKHEVVRGLVTYQNNAMKIESETRILTQNERKKIARRRQEERQTESPTSVDNVDVASAPESVQSPNGNIAQRPSFLDRVNSMMQKRQQSLTLNPLNSSSASFSSVGSRETLSRSSSSGRSSFYVRAHESFSESASSISSSVGRGVEQVSNSVSRISTQIKNITKVTADNIEFLQGRACLAEGIINRGDGRIERGLRYSVPGHPVFIVGNGHVLENGFWEPARFEYNMKTQVQSVQRLEIPGPSSNDLDKKQPSVPTRFSGGEGA